MNWQLKTSWKVLVLLLALQVASFLPETARGYAIDDDGRNPRSGDENPQPYYEDPLDEFSINGYPQIGPFGDDYLSQPDNHYDYFEDKDGPISSEEESAESAEHPGSPLMLENHTDDEGSSAEDLKTVQKRGWFFNLGDSLGGERGRTSYLRRHHPFCFSHGMSCTMAPNSCCNDSVCRCNLFGSNCKCDRPGLLFG
ncbi:hypothetical protein TCAL_06687 [Tigriopus californicus]|uniref:EGF-like domain-containing protein n=1 Tax=Tigriopus californicus TaxID=6832 RepID=A0A553P5X8_TIGCA|nr:uncharacterized protein LOC131877971 isoform X5 [Tigriopus californicus]TRY73088.1 hypothetical protein TCAL_06687 [Tigriopus californicus]